MQTNIPIPKTLTPDDLARFCGVSRRTLYRWQRRGHLPAPIKQYGRCKFVVRDVLAAIKKHGLQADAIIRELAEQTDTTESP